MTTLTHSAISMFRQCPRRFEHRYIDELVPAHWTGSPALRFGTAIHAWLEAWYRRELFAPPSDWRSDGDAVLFHAAIEAYKLQYPTEIWRVVAVESQFKVTLPGINVTVEGKRDLVVELEGEPWLVEHKSSTAMGVADMERVGIDGQVLTYADATGVEIGRPVAGVIYNVVKRCQLRQKQNETPEQFKARVIAWYGDPENHAFLRERARINPRMIEQNRLNVAATAGMINVCETTGYYPQNAGVTTGACAKWGRECEYAPLCKSLKSAHVLADYVRKEPNEELNGEVDQD